MPKLGGSVDPFEVDLLEGEALLVVDERLAKSDWAFLWTNAAATNHDVILIDETIMREATERIDGFFSTISFTFAIVLAFFSQAGVANSEDLLVDFSTMMITLLTSTSNSELNARRMPCSNAGDFAETLVCLANSSNTMAVTTQLRVSYLTNSLARRHSSTITNHSRISWLQNPNLRIMPSTFSTKSIAFNDKLPYLEKDDMNTSLEQLKRRSREALLNSSDPIETMKMIDSIQGLGISHHFEDEINIQLERICDWDASTNLFATSLQFRLLRHNGWPTSSDIFRNFLDKSGNVKETLTKDISGMLSLYEASYLGTEDEQILKKAMEFSRAHLNKLISHMSPEIGYKHIVRSLTLPRHLRMIRLEARNYMDEYSHATNQIPALMELAKLDFDMIQSLHQRELAEICRWWKELGLIEKLSFERDRPTECFLWTVGVFPEPSHSNCRIELTKTICILDVIDDIFDNYGTLDELILFTDAIKRWDLDSMEKLPEYMKICYMALYNTTNEISYKILKEHGLTVVSHLKRTWMDMFDAYLEEAKWFNSGHVPSLRTYLDNGAISVGSCMALVHATFLIGDGFSKETISMLKPYPRLFTCSGEILRLWDDLGTSTEEQERGDNASSIQCFMGENNIVDENEGRKHIRLLIGNLWRELNGLAMTKILPLSVIKASLNMARTAQVIYQHGDDKSTFTVDDYVKTLILTPLPSSH